MADRTNMLVDYNGRTNRFQIQLPFNKNGIIKQCQGYRWLKRTKCWTIPAVRKNVETLEKHNFIWTPEAKDKASEVGEAVVRAQGIKFPAYYDFKYEPYEKQMEAIKVSYGQKVFAYFMDMGTGKTKVVIDVISALWMEGKLKQALIVCPASIQDNWADELEIHCPIDYSAHVYDSKKFKKFEKWRDDKGTLDTKLRVLIVGIESFSAGRAADTCFDYCLLAPTYMAVDESSRIKNFDARRTEKCIEIGRNAEFRSIMTGTEITQGPLDLFAQFEYLDTNIFGFGDYYAFRNHFALMGGYDNKEVVAYDNLDELVQTIQPFVFQCSLEDVKDMPGRQWEVRHVTATKEQKDLLKQIAKGHAQVGDIDIEVRNVLEKLLRMQQIVNGHYIEYIMDPVTEKTKRKAHFLKGQPKFNELKAIREEHRLPQVTWCKYHPDLELVRPIFPARVEFHGKVPKAELQPNVRAFQAGKVKDLLGNPATGGIGQTMTAARIMVYYSNSFSLEERLQSERRIWRIGQEYPVKYIDLVMKGTVDELAKESLEDKKDLADFVRERIRQGQDTGALLAGLTGS